MMGASCSVFFTTLRHHLTSIVGRYGYTSENKNNALKLLTDTFDNATRY